MRQMGWSWAELQATPLYVRRYCADFTAIRHRIAANHNAQPPAQPPGG